MVSAMRVPKALKFVVSIFLGCAAGGVLGSLLRSEIPPQCSLALSSLFLTWPGFIVITLSGVSIVSAALFAVAWLTPGSSKFLSSPDYPSLSNRKVFGSTAVGMAALGLMLCMLTLAGPSGCIRLPDWAALIGLPVTIAAYTAVCAYMQRHQVGFRELNLRCYSATMQILGPVLLAWAGLAELGIGVDFGPLALIAVLSAVTVVGHGVGTLSYEREIRSARGSGET